jgi:tetratricopeptide (TPR) repeat protein
MVEVFQAGGSIPFARFFLLLILSVFVSSAPLLADSTVTLNKAIDALSNPRLAGAAEEKLKTLMKDEDATVRVRARVALAGQWRLKGKTEAALPLVEPYSELKPENLVEPRVQGFVEAARCQAALNQLVGAYKLLDYGKEHAEGIPAILVREALADMVEPIPELDKALAYLKEAETYGNGYFQQKLIRSSDTDPGKKEDAKPGCERWPGLRTELQVRIAALERKLRIQRFGLDYVLYAEAQESRKSIHFLSTDFTSLSHIYPASEKTRNVPCPGADYKKALETYNEIIEKFPEGVFAEVSKCYRNLCLAKLGQVDEAIRGLEAFCKENSKGPYQGEGWKYLGDLYLQDRWDVKKAAECYQAAISWCRDMRTRTEASKLYAVPAKCQEPAKPPEKWQVMTAWGDIEEVPLPSGSIVNRSTASWYLDKLEEDCEFNLGYTLVVTDKWDEAMRHFQQAGQLDPLLTEAERKGYFSTMWRLKAASERKTLVGYAEENRSLSPKDRAIVYWADFLYLRKGFDRAFSLYSRLYAAADSARDGETASRAALGKVLALMQEKKQQEARQMAEDVLKRWPKTASAPYLSFLCGCTCGMKDFYAEARKCYQRTYTMYPKSRFAEQARFYEVFQGMCPQTLDERRKLAEAFKRDFPSAIQAIQSLEQSIAYWEKVAEDEKKTKGQGS